MKNILILISFLYLTGGVHAQPSSEKEAQEFNYNEKFEEGKQFFVNQDYQKALEVHYDILEFLLNNKNNNEEQYNRLANNYKRLSNLYLFLNDTLSFIYADSAIINAEKTTDNVLIERCYNLQYYCFYDLPNSAKKLNTIADKCIEYSILANNNKMLGEAYMHKCNALVELNKIEEGDSYCKKAETLFKEMEDDLYLASVYNNIGNVFLKSNQLKKATLYHQKGYDLSVTTNVLSYIVDGSKNLADDYYKLKDYKSSSDYYKIFSDSLVVQYKQLLDEKFTEADSKFNIEQKNKEIAEQNLKLSEQKLELIKQTTLRNNIIYLSLIFLLIAIAIYQWYIHKQKKKKQLAEQELQKEQEMNKLRTNFLENIAHEIRTPITLINGHLTLALEKTEQESSVAKNIKAAINSSDKVLSNANEILELLKLEKGKLPIRKSEIQLQSFLKRVFYSFESLAEIKKIQLEYISNLQDDVTIDSDENRLEKILNNFIANAIKFSPSNSKIIFNVISSNTNLTISVTDFGPGIAFDEQTKIFNRFYQAKTASNIGGVGVGLSLAKEFAESLDGSISVTSEPNKGATFILNLPIEVYTSTKRIEQTSFNVKVKNQIPDISLQAKTKILIIEDNPEMSAYLSEILSSQFECDVAFNGMEGLQKIQTKKYSLIISDVMMPQMDGFELKQKINLITNYKNVPFIFITAKAQLSDRIVGYNLGVDDYITKPFVKEELLARVKMLLVNKKERENWMKENPDFIDNNETIEEQLLTKIKTIILNNLSEENFKVTDLANEVAYSQRQLTRLLKKATGLSPVQYILEIRLQKAYLCLTEKRFSTLAEVRNYVGIPSSSHFNKKFIERFGVKPSEVVSTDN